MGIFVYLLLAGVFAFLGYQLYGLYKDIRKKIKKRKGNNHEQSSDEKK